MGAPRMNDRPTTVGRPSPETPAQGRPVLVRATGHLRSRAFDPLPAIPPNGDRERVATPDVLRAAGQSLLVGVAIGLPVVAVAGADWLWVVVGLVAAALVMRELARRVTFTFGEGFLAFRDRDEWPRGVQEEYDVRYGLPRRGGATPAG
jgi:hypothetical protein